MANWSDPRPGTVPLSRAGTSTVARDEGLRSYMLSVYNYMLSGVLLTGVVAMLFARTDWALAMFNESGRGLSGLGVVVSLAPLALVFAMSFGRNRFSAGTLQLMFWAFAFVMGLSMSTIFLVYTSGSIAQVFFATSAGFGALSLWGYTTRRDLSGFGTFLLMGLVGLLVAMLLNVFFFRSGEMNLVISVIGVLIFSGLTAYDTQKIKGLYDYVAGTEMQGKTAILGALTLYLDFINMFLFLLRIFGGSRN